MNQKDMTQGEYQYSAKARDAAMHAMQLLQMSTAWKEIEAIKASGESQYRTENSFERNITYLAIPAAMAEAYLPTSEQNLPGDDLTVGLLQLYQFIMAFDHGIDDVNADAFLQAFRMYRHAVPRILSVFPVNLHDNVLLRLDACMLDTFKALYQERKQTGCILTKKAQFADIAVNKAKLSHLVPVLIALHAGVSDGVGSISACQCKALDYMHIGMQWMDDVQDVARDQRQEQSTWALRLLDEWCDSNGIQMRTLDPELLRKLAYTSGIASICTREAIIEFEKAKLAISDIHMPT